MLARFNSIERMQAQRQREVGRALDYGALVISLVRAARYDNEGDVVSY
jgi:hypothetical protein